MNKLTRNRIQCPECLDIIESLTRHDFKVCSCGIGYGVFVDGGLDYQRVGGGAMAGIINLAEFERVVPECIECGRPCEYCKEDQDD